MDRPQTDLIAEFVCPKCGRRYETAGAKSCCWEPVRPAEYVRHQAWQKTCEECGGPVHWVVVDECWVHESEFSPCVLNDGPGS